jgi:hypothetical protein
VWFGPRGTGRSGGLRSLGRRLAPDGDQAQQSESLV